MSAQYDARVKTVKAYPLLCDDAVDLFLSMCDCSRKDFEYEQSQTVEDYLYTKEAK